MIQDLVMITMNSLIQPRVVSNFHFMSYDIFSKIAMCFTAACGTQAANAASVIIPCYLQPAKKKKKSPVLFQLQWGELKMQMARLSVLFNKPCGEMVSSLAGGVIDILRSITLIINLNAIEGADNKELKRKSLAESEKKKEEEQEGQCMNYTFSPQSEVPALFMSKKKRPIQLSRNCALSAVEGNSSSLNT